VEKGWRRESRRRGGEDDGVRENSGGIRRERERPGRDMDQGALEDIKELTLTAD
jgi:hypothetical protein